MSAVVATSRTVEPQPEALAATFDALFRQLAARLEEAPSTRPLGPDRIPVREIRTAAALFAARSSGRADDLGSDQGHARELERALRAMPEDAREFDPLVVFEIAGTDFCVDGHHRLAVYRAVSGPTALVPVVRIGGTLGHAVAASVQANSMTFLPMSRAERQEAAWKLVKIGQGSKREQAALSGMGETFIAKLRRLKRALEESHSGHEWGSLWEAERLARGGEVALPDWTDEMADAEVAEYVGRLRKTLGAKLHRRLPAVVRAMAEIVGPAILWETMREEVERSGHFEFATGDEDPDDDAAF